MIMEKIKKILFWLIRSAFGCLILLFLILLIVGAIYAVKSFMEGLAVNRAAELVKEKVKFPSEKEIAGCAHPQIGVTIVSLGGDTFFGVKNNNVFIPKISEYYDNNAKGLAPDLPIEDCGADIYYLMEHCR